LKMANLVYPQNLGDFHTIYILWAMTPRERPSVVNSQCSRSARRVKATVESLSPRRNCAQTR
jgi:hypothetical protein